MPQYADKAEAFLSRYELRLKLKYLGDDEPKYYNEDRKLPHYIVTLRRVNGPKFAFDFWHGLMVPETSDDQEPSSYDILASLGESSRLSPDPDEVYEEFGEMRPSQAIGMSRFANRVRKFFTHKELVELRKIGLEAASSARTQPRRTPAGRIPLKQTA